MRLDFVKMHGLGNDFVIIDERAGGHALTAAQFARLADRRRGIGCDQVLLLERPRDARAAARYRVVNADGSPAEHCGNGVRCVARYLARHGGTGARIDLEIGNAIYALDLLDDGNVRVDMGIPCFAPGAIPLTVAAEQARYTHTVDKREIVFGAVSIGNPHAVIEVADAAAAPVAVLGPAVQACGLFPAGVNVGFMQVDARDAITLRVYERGAGETEACGTGACAAMVIGRRWGRLDACVEVSLRGGRLVIEWDGDPAHSVWMTGPAAFVFEGSIDL
ncbi:MAG: diaminopimelate epimerase [Gammaproteobacteria bacterium]